MAGAQSHPTTYPIKTGETQQKVGDPSGPVVLPAGIEPCPPVGIQTDPPVAQNNEPGGYINTFNWYKGLPHPDPQLNERRYQVNSQYSSTAELFMPWEQPSNSNMDRIAGKRDLPKDGWELVRRDLGFTGAGSPRTVDNPHVILYNRHTGMLRVFVAQGRLFAQNQLAEIKLVFAGDAGKKAGTLNRQSALGVALEDTEVGNANAMVSVARFMNVEMKWFMADFPMDYDPCVCLFDSKMSIEVNLISEANIQMTGLTTGTFVTATGGSGTTSAEFDKGPSFLKKANGAIAAGGKVYDNLNKFSSSLKGKADVQQAGSTNPVVGAQATTNRKLLIDQFKNALASVDFIKQGLAALPYVGAAVGALDFFFGGGKEESAPQPIALQPMTIETTTQFTGTITASTLYTGFSFINPGTRQQAATPERYPYYNETMGVFSLLRRPVVQYDQVLYIDEQDRARRAIHYRVPQDLQYTVNPAAGLVIQDFQVALVLEQTNPTAQPGWDFTEFEAMRKPTGSTLLPVYRSEYVNSGNLRDRIFTLDTYRGSPINRNPEDFTVTNQSDQVFLKFMINFRDATPGPNRQNTLLVVKYPVTVQSVADVGQPGPANRPAVLAPQTAEALGAFCTSNTYKDIMALRPAASSAAGAARPASALAEAPAIYPNPATNQAVVRLHLREASGADVVVRDPVGREVYRSGHLYPAGVTELAIPTAGLSNGVYYCTVKVNGQQQTQKLVVTH